MKKIILCICLFCHVTAFSQKDISCNVVALEIKYFDKPLIFGYRNKPVSQRKTKGVCKLKHTFLMTDSLCLNMLQEKMPLKGEIFMDSALFDFNCYVYQDKPYNLVADYILPCMKDTLYANILKNTYYKYMANPSVRWGEKQDIKEFSINRLYHRKFLIVEMSVGFFNEYGKIWNPQRYRYSEKAKDKNRRFKVAIPLKEDE